MCFLSKFQPECTVKKLNFPEKQVILTSPIHESSWRFISLADAKRETTEERAVIISGRTFHSLCFTSIISLLPVEVWFITAVKKTPQFPVRSWKRLSHPHLQCPRSQPHGIWENRSDQVPLSNVSWGKSSFRFFLSVYWSYPFWTSYFKVVTTSWIL